MEEQRGSAVLTARRQRVLMALVDEYVESAAPVGSTRIAQQYLKEVSPATVRNELMGLETEGYALSPHTSAGRIPTRTGYRVFVNTLLLRGGFEGGQDAPLAGPGSPGSPASPIKPGSSTSPAGPAGPAGLANLAGLAGLTGGDPRERDVERDAEQHGDRILAFLSEATGLLCVLWRIRSDIAVRRRGMSRLLAQPEFRDARALVPLVQLVEDDAALIQLLKTTLRGNGLMVKIGIEDEDGYLSSYSLVAEAYGEARSQGALAVFGPTRMDYRRVIPAVLLASRLLGSQ